MRRPPTAPSSPSATTWIGLLAVFGLGLLLVLPLDAFRKSREGRKELPGASLAEPAAPREAVDPVKLTQSLASAARALAEIEALKREASMQVRRPLPADASVPDQRPLPAGTSPPDDTPRPASQPDGTTPADERAAAEPAQAEPSAPSQGSPSTTSTRCVASYLPDVAFSGDELDFVCTEEQLWTIEGHAYLRIAPLGSRGGELWRHLGAYSMMALATMRAACCPNAEPLLAVVPTLKCGVLRDAVREIGPMPDQESYARVAELLDCLRERKAHLPKRWSTYSVAQRDRALRAFIEHARARASSGDLPP